MMLAIGCVEGSGCVEPSDLQNLSNYVCC